jgi:hypothetical protein
VRHFFPLRVVLLATFLVIVLLRFLFIAFSSHRLCRLILLIKRLLLIRCQLITIARDDIRNGLNKGNVFLFGLFCAIRPFLL